MFYSQKLSLIAIPSISIEHLQAKTRVFSSQKRFHFFSKKSSHKKGEIPTSCSAKRFYVSPILCDGSFLLLSYLQQEDTQIKAFFIFNLESLFVFIRDSLNRSSLHKFMLFQCAARSDHRKGKLKQSETIVRRSKWWINIDRKS